MNNRRRTRLRTIEGDLSRCLDLLNSIYEEEQDCIDNIPENLQDTQRYEGMEECIEFLYTAVDSIEDAIDNIQNAINN